MSEPKPDSKHNIIFLDIDGVLNTEHHLRRQKVETGEISGSNWCPTACRHISLLCQQFYARIVISSTWRYNHSMESLRELLKKNEINPHYLVGLTPALIYMEGPDSYVRGDEIARWLEENGYLDPSASTSALTSTYVIIDDLSEKQFLKEQHPRLVRVHPDKGFAEKEAAVKAGKILEAADSSHI